jgi:beta-lactamase class D
MQVSVLLFFCACSLAAGVYSSHAPEEETAATISVVDFASLFAHHGVKGSFLLFNSGLNSYTAYDTGRCRQGFIPASTFKIFNSLVGLQSGVIPNERYVMKWDSVIRGVPAWNHDQDMAEAIRNSTVWYYQELARRVGQKRMQEYVEGEHYGNMNISGDIDQFWLNGGLRISQFEQIDLLRRLHNGRLHFSKRSMETVKRILILKDTTTYTLRGKTGWSVIDSVNYDWFVGYLERDGNVYYFATNIEAREPAPDSFADARKEITEEILKGMRLL